MRRSILFLLGLLVPAASCGAAPPLVLAAASLQESLGAVADAWARAGHPRPVLSFAASSAAARQIAAGAPGDLFVSADTGWMDDLDRHGMLAPGTRATLLTNGLVLVAPAATARPLPVRPGFPLARALGGGRLALADPDAVPAGLYAKQALVRLGVWPTVAGRIARGDSVRGALALVERGETPYGIVYRTDALVSRRVRVVGIVPDASHRPILYPVALLKASRSPDARPFLRYLRSDAAGAIFRRYGFGTP